MESGYPWGWMMRLFCGICRCSWRTHMGMQVVFYKVDNGRLCVWVAAPPKRKRFQGTTMASGRDLSHDLAQFVVETTLGLHHGFWGLLANGATFKSVVGRRRTKPGQQLIRAHREALNATEHLVNAHVAAWRTGCSNPSGSRPGCHVRPLAGA